MRASVGWAFDFGWRRYVTTILATCPVCGEVELTITDVQLVICAFRKEWSYYTFLCPSCRKLVSKRASNSAIALLISADIKREIWSAPKEALEVHAGPPLGDEDLADFSRALADEQTLLQAIAEFFPPHEEETGE